jgi:hypothetical protein
MNSQRLQISSGMSTSISLFCVVPVKRRCPTLFLKDVRLPDLTRATIHSHATPSIKIGTNMALFLALLRYSLLSYTRRNEVSTKRQEVLA